jgi:hypothetical protein
MISTIFSSIGLNENTTSLLATGVLGGEWSVFNTELTSSYQCDLHDARIAVDRLSWKAITPAHRIICHDDLHDSPRSFERFLRA